MSASDTVCLVRYQGAWARWTATSAAGWPCWAYQHTTRLTHSRPKGRCAGRRGGGAVAGLADPGDLPALFEQDLDLPAGGVALHQLGRGGGKVGGDQGQVEPVGGAWAADQHHLDRAGAEHGGPQAREAAIAARPLWP